MSTININMAGSTPSIGGSTGGAGFSDALSNMTQGLGGEQKVKGKDQIIEALLEALQDMATGGQDNKQSMGDYQQNCPCCKACG